MCEKLAPIGKWDDIVEAFRLLSSPPPPPPPSAIDEHANHSDPNWLLNSNAHKARLEIAKSLETIVNSLPGDIVVRDICPIVEATFLNDSNDEVKIVTISQLHHLLQKKCSAMMKNEGTSDENKNASSPPPPSSGRSAPIVNLLSSLAEDSSAYVSLSPLKSRKPAAAAAVRGKLESSTRIGFLVGEHLEQHADATTTVFSSVHIFEALKRPSERREESRELDGFVLLRVQEQFNASVFRTADVVFVQSR